jgi:hypothetical protein
LRYASYVASRKRLERFTEPGTIALVDATGAGAGRVGGLVVGAATGTAARTVEPMGKGTSAAPSTSNTARSAGRRVIGSMLRGPSMGAPP